MSMHHPSIDWTRFLQLALASVGTSVPLVLAASALAAPIFLPLGDLPGGGGFSDARAISADGSTVVGTSQSASGFEAFRWTSSGGMGGLGDLPDGGFDSGAVGASGDGSTIVGQTCGPTQESASSFKGKNLAIIRKWASFSNNDACSSMAQAAMRQSPGLPIVLPLFLKAR